MSNSERLPGLSGQDQGKVAACTRAQGQYRALAPAAPGSALSAPLGTGVETPTSTQPVSSSSPGASSSRDVRARVRSVSRLAPGYTVYRRSRMAEEGVPANAELV